MFIADLCGVTAENGANVPDLELRILFVKSEYMLGRYSPIVSNADLKKEFIREPCKYVRSAQQVLVTSSFGASKENRNNFMPTVGRGRVGGEQMFANKLLQFRMSVREVSKSE